MTEDTVVQLRQPGAFSEDPLTEVLRLGARRLLAQAVEMGVTAFVEMHADQRVLPRFRKAARVGRASHGKLDSYLPDNSQALSNTGPKITTPQMSGVG